ncbi:hypothetical protein GGX14DRAFT_385585 [Mycena pura]|uniref:Uncharacterized protein n=1 Tax=Mycena pura TaxID=153505 RepID=A0AAD7E3H2_9AGAR|nr:hypothetical protein GGX14DRAFT_385585 [Mycena pura]
MPLHVSSQTRAGDAKPPAKRKSRKKYIIDDASNNENQIDVDPDPDFEERKANEGVDQGEGLEDEEKAPAKRRKKAAPRSSPPSTTRGAGYSPRAQRRLAASKPGVAKLHRLDSAICESACVSGVGGTAMACVMRAAGGITLPSGPFMPRNAMLGVSMDGLHFDEAYYARTTLTSLRDAPGKKPHVNVDLVMTSVHVLPFLHGIYACPGCFFATNSIKLILAYLLLNYDIQPFPAHPPNILLGDISVAPVNAMTRICRRVKI